MSYHNGSSDEPGKGTGGMGGFFPSGGEDNGGVSGGGLITDRLKPVSEAISSVGYTAAGTDSPQLLSISKSTSSTSTKISDPKALVVQNVSNIPTIVMFGYQSYYGDYDDISSEWTTTPKVAGHASPTGDTAVAGIVYLHVLLHPGESIQPPLRGVISVVGSVSAVPETDTFADQSLYALEGTVVDFTAPDSNAYVDSGIDSDDGAGADITGSDSATNLIIEQTNGQSLFRVGDLIQVNTEIMEVTAVGDGSTAAKTNLTVIRGLYGSDAASDHADDAAIRFPFFNTYKDYDDTYKLATDRNGKWHSTNFFGYGRTAYDGTAFGLNPGSIVIRFYKPGYQELGLSGITASTDTGLTAGSYWFKIAIDGGTAESINFEVDSNNTNWGGTSGVLSVIQTALDDKYNNTDSNTWQQKSSIGIVNGDVRFTSGQGLSTSAIALTAGTDGASASYNIFAQQNGWFPALANIEKAVVAKLPDKQLYNPVTYATTPNLIEYAYDNGSSGIVGKCRGSINYETGELFLFNAPPLASFEVSVIHSTPFSGKRDTGSNSANLCLRPNSLIAVHANVLNTQVTGKVKVSVY